MHTLNIIINLFERVKILARDKIMTGMINVFNCNYLFAYVIGISFIYNNCNNTIIIIEL